MNRDFFIRRATYDDVLDIIQLQIENYLFNPDCYAIKNGCNHNLFSPLEIKNLMKKGSIVVASKVHENDQAYEGPSKSLLGYIITQKNQENTTILQLCVDGNCRRKGIGSELLEIIKKTSKNLQTLILEQNMAGKSFLLKHSFKETPVKVRMPVDENKILVTYI